MDPRLRGRGDRADNRSSLTLEPMQLRNARLCLDCEEIHDSAHCPACASESFAFITRWVPTPSSEPAPAGPAAVRTERPERPPQSLEPATRETLDTYRQLLGGRPRNGDS
jgi:hypothetical protein